MPIWIALYQRTGRGLGPVYASASGALMRVLCSRWRSRGCGLPLNSAPAASRGVEPRGRRPRGSPRMPPSDDSIREIAKAFRRHVDAATLEKIINELLDVPGNKSFRDAIEKLARELMQRSD